MILCGSERLILNPLLRPKGGGRSEGKKIKLSYSERSRLDVKAQKLLKQYRRKTYFSVSVRIVMGLTRQRFAPPLSYIIYECDISSGISDYIYNLSYFIIYKLKWPRS